MLLILVQTVLGGNWSFFYGSSNPYYFKETSLGNVMDSQNGLWIYMKIDNVETQIYTANATVSNIRLNTTWKARRKSDYINVIYTLTNLDTVQHSVGLATSWFAYFKSQFALMDNIPGFKGIFINNSGVNASLLLRDSYDVTNVDTYIYRGNSGSIADGISDRWKNRTQWDPKFQDSFSQLSFSWQNRTIKPQETIQFEYAIGEGEYKKEFGVNILTNIEPYYSPSTQLIIKLQIDTLYSNDTFAVYREIDGQNQTQLLNYIDTGEPVNYTDTISLPSSIGWHTITYTATDNGTVADVRTINILIDHPPTITLVSETRESYYIGENVSLTIDVYDDTLATLKIFDTNQNYYMQNISCYQSVNRTIATYTIPNYAIESIHMVTIVAVNEFGLSSKTIQFSYTVIDNKPPDVIIDTKLDAYYTSSSKIDISGRFRDLDGQSTVCLFSSINNSLIQSRGCQYLSGTDYEDFEFTFETPFMINTINVLRIYAVDQKQGYSTPFVHTFAVVPESFGCSDEVDYSSYSIERGFLLFMTAAFD